MKPPTQKTLSCPVPSLSASLWNPEMISTRHCGATFGQHLFPCRPDLEESDLGFCCQAPLYLSLLWRDDRGCSVKHWVTVQWLEAF